MADNQEHIKPTAELIRQYLDGTLDDKTMHALEKQALDDPFLAEALEGFAMHAADQRPALDDLRARLEQRVKPAAKVRRLDYRWLAAASVLLLISITAVFIMNRPVRPVNDIAQAKELPRRDTAAAAATPAPADSVEAEEDANAPAANAAEAPAKNEQAAAPSPPKARPTPVPAAAPAMKMAAKAPEPESRNQAARLFTDKIDTIRIGRYAADSTAYAVQAPPALGRKVEGKITGAQSPYPNYFAEHDERLISGVVVDAKTGRRLPGVTVSETGTSKGAVTDTSGNFALKVNPRNKVELDFSYLGYEKTNVKVAPDAGTLNVQMPVSESALNETVVVGYGAKKKTVPERELAAAGKEDRIMIRGISSSPGGVIPPRPVIRGATYRDYLESRRKLVIPGLLENKVGQVRVSFTVMPDSTLRQFKVLESMGDIANKAAIRIIKEGPKWAPASNGKKATAEVTVPLTLMKQE